MKLFPTVFLLGLAGFDPSGAVIIVSALAMGLHKKEIIKFALTTFVGTILVGVFFSELLGTSINYISELLNRIPDIVYMWLELVIGVILVCWASKRFLFKKKSEEKNEEPFYKKYFKKGLFVVGLFFAITALTDPSFLALITLSGHSDNLLSVILAHCIWISISQLPLLVLTIAIAFNKHEKAINYFKNILSKNNRIEKLKKIFSILLSVLILVLGGLTVFDSIYFCFNGVWIF